MEDKIACVIFAMGGGECADSVEGVGKLYIFEKVLLYCWCL